MQNSLGEISDNVGESRLHEPTFIYSLIYISRCQYSFKNNNEINLIIECINVVPYVIHLHVDKKVCEVGHDHLSRLITKPVL